MATESATESVAEAAREPEDPSACDVLILGASMAGIDVLYHLRRRGAVGRRLKVIVVDRQPAHGYIPLVQERLCARIDRAASELETRTIIDGDPNARFVLGEVESFDPERRAVTLRGGEVLRGAYVVVALGSVVTPPPGLPGRERALGYKFADGFERSTARLEQALRGEGPGQDAPRFVVVGGGISGVELAGDLAHLAARRPDGWRVPQVTLVQGADRLLPSMTRRAGTLAARHLKRQGVELRLGARVVAIREGEVVLRPKGAGPGESASGPYREGERAGEQTLACAGVYWAGGVRPAPALQRLNLPLTEDGWLKVGPTLQCFPEARPRLPEIFACGDAARIVGGDASAPWPTMQRAIECLWQADLVARNILQLERYTPGGESTYPPPLTPHVLREDFFHGVSVGARSMIVYGRVAIELGAWAVWFRRFLMRQYFRRYRGLRRA